MESILKSFQLLVVVFLTLTFIFNIQQGLPRMPWDVYLDKGGFRIHLPFITSIVVAVVLTFILNFFQ